MNIKVKLLNDKAQMPFKSTPYAAGADLYVTSWEFDDKCNIVYHTGIAMEIPEGFVGLLFPRSSSAGMLDHIMHNCVGVIDSDYRGEILAKFMLTDESGFERYDIGERCCQMVVVPIPPTTYVQATELSKTERDTKGYGQQSGK